MPSCSGCGSGTHLDVDQQHVGTVGQHTQAAWQVSDIRTEMAELRTHGIKAEDFDTRGQRPKSWRTSRAGLARLLARRSTSPLRSESVTGATQEQEVALVLESASTHVMIAVKDLGRAKEFYSGMLGLTASDERHGSGIRYETQAGSWFLVYRSEFAGTAKSTCMRFEVEDVESAVRQLRDRGIVFEEYDLPAVKTVDGIAEHESGARGAWFKDPDGNILQLGQYGK